MFLDFSFFGFGFFCWRKEITSEQNESLKLTVGHLEGGMWALTSRRSPATRRYLVSVILSFLLCEMGKVTGTYFTGLLKEPDEKINVKHLFIEVPGIEQALNKQQ